MYSTAWARARLVFKPRFDSRCASFLFLSSSRSFSSSSFFPVFHLSNLSHPYLPTHSHCKSLLIPSLPPSPRLRHKQS